MQHEDVLGKLVSSLTGLAPLVCQTVEKRVSSEIMKYSARQILTFCTPKGRRFEPPKTAEEIVKKGKDYARALYHFLAGKKMDGERVDSIVTSKIAAAADQAFVQAISSTEFSNALVTQISRLDAGTIVDAEVREEVKRIEKWLQRELEEAIKDAGGGSLKGEIATMTTEQIVHFFQHTAAGAAVLTAFGTAAATTAGKIAIAAILKTAIATPIVKAALVNAAHHVGMSVGVKVAMTTVLLPVLHLPAWLPPEAVTILLILAILAVMLAWAVVHLPETLSKAVPKELTKQITAQWPEISRQLVSQTIMEGTKIQLMAARRTRRARIMIVTAIGVATLAVAVLLI